MSIINNNVKPEGTYGITAAKGVSKNDKKVSGLSENAQKYLKQLKAKYGNVDIIVADYSTDEEAQKILSRGTGEYNCVITPETLEKMASDDNERAKYEGIIDDAVANLQDIGEKLGEDAEKVKTYGVSVDSDGKVSYYAILKETLDANAKAREEAVKKAEEADKKAAKADKADKAGKKEPAVKTVRASSIEELIELIKSDGKSGAAKTHGGDRIDFGAKPADMIKEFMPQAPAAPDMPHAPFDFKA